MGAIAIILTVAFSWVMVFLVFTAGFLVGRTMGKFAGDLPQTKVFKRKPVPVTQPLKPVEGEVPGIDVDAERKKIVLRAKQQFGMSDSKAADFADNIIRLGSATLGRLHQKG